MKRYFLIDLENVGKWAFDGSSREILKKVTIEDFFVLCANKMHGNGSIPGELLSALACAGANFRVIEIANVGKNAMDFCLASQLGYLISQDGNSAEYWIVSNDRGFEACVEFGRSMGVKVGITPSFNICEQRKATQEEERAVLRDLLSDLNPKVAVITHRCMVAAKSLEDYHNRLQKELHEGQATKVYRVTKHLLAPQD